MKNRKYLHLRRDGDFANTQHPGHMFTKIYL